MQEFSFSTRIYFGSSALARLEQIKGKKILIITDAFMMKSGAVDQIKSHLPGCEISIFSGVLPDPPIEVVAQGVKALQECNAEILVALGGGSTLDAAKAIHAIAGEATDLDTEHIEYFAIPTTSGTGSEVTDFAVITDAEKGIKYPLVSPSLRPLVAILDPSLVVTAPPSVTADTGMDVITHALEAYVSTGANDFSDALCEKSLSLSFRFLPLAFQNGQDLLAREKMHNASCMAGLAFNSAGLGVNHGLAHAIGGRLHIPHGRLNAMLLPLVMRYNARLDDPSSTPPVLAAKKYQHIAKVLGMPAPAAKLGASNVIRTVERLVHNLGIPATLREYGTDMELFRKLREDIISAAMDDITTSYNPRKVTKADLSILLDRLAG